jgi:aspartate/glutamate racemase
MHKKISILGGMLSESTIKDYDQMTEKRQGERDSISMHRMEKKIMQS